MTLTVLHTSQEAAEWLRARATDLCCDSRQSTSGEAFVAWPGAAADGRRYVTDALARGTNACLVAQEGVEEFGFSDARIAAYAGLKQDISEIAAHFYRQPSKELLVIAATGTNGKTSVCWWLAQALSGIDCNLLSKTQLPAQVLQPEMAKTHSKMQRALGPGGLIGTLGVGRPGAMLSSGLTTPDPVLLQRSLRRMVDEGFASCAIEASSIGIVERRMDAVQVDVALFTNFTQDHLDYHRSMDAYWQAKRSLFDWPELSAAVVNVDDAHGQLLAGELAARGAISLWTYGLAPGARIQAHKIEHQQSGMRFELREGEATCAVQTSVIGAFNVSNLLAVAATLRAVGATLERVAEILSRLEPVQGRLEVVNAGASLPLAVVDYAHTPDALEQALKAVRPLASARNGQLWAVFGCGGDRDPGKRPIMGGIATKGADRVVVTSDNPRSEAPQAIVEAVAQGAGPKAHVQVDRALAISEVIAQAHAHDVVLIAGKGHEEYQEIEGVKLAFSDVTHARAALARRAALGVSA